MAGLPTLPGSFQKSSKREEFCDDLRQRKTLLLQKARKLEKEAELLTQLIGAAYQIPIEA